MLVLFAALVGIGHAARACEKYNDNRNMRGCMGDPACETVTLHLSGWNCAEVKCKEHNKNRSMMGCIRDAACEIVNLDDSNSKGWACREVENLKKDETPVSNALPTCDTFKNNGACNAASYCKWKAKRGKRKDAKCDTKKCKKIKDEGACTEITGCAWDGKRKGRQCRNE